MDANVIERLKNYCASHQDLLKYIKGIDSETQKIVLDNGSGNTKRVTIGDLENNKFDFVKFDIIQEQNDIETLEVLTENPTPEIKVPKTMAELNIAIQNKDEKAIDKALETFAINDKTGVVDINRAISIVTNNAVSEAVNCINKSVDFNTDMSKYDITGKRLEDNTNKKEIVVDEIIKKAFDSFIRPYTNISIMKGTNPEIYSEENMKKAYEKVKIMVEGKLNLSNEKILPTPEKKQEEQVPKKDNANALVLKPEPMLPAKTGGFADVVILTIIVLIYAAIIVNLILKLQ